VEPPNKGYLKFNRGIFDMELDTFIFCPKVCPANCKGSSIVMILYNIDFT